MLEELSWVSAIRSDALTPIVIIMTQLGSVYFLLPFLAILYWLWDRDTSLRVSVFAVASLILNKILKLMIEAPRPDEAMALISASGFGMPSGHAQASVAVWGFLAISVERKWLKALCVLIIVLISFSRIYLGVHTPLQVLMGNLVGAGALLFGYLIFRFAAPLWGHWSEMSKASILSLWVFLAALAVPAGSSPGSVIPDRTLTLTAAFVLAGLWGGAAVERKRTDFAASRDLGTRLATLGIGVILYGAVFVLALLLLSEFGVTYPYLIFGIGFVLGIAPTLIVPTLLDRLGIARR